MSQKTIRTVGLPFEAGIIDIGAHSVRLEIFQVAKDGSIETLESVTRIINLGYDAFRRGAISPENINLLCAILSDCARRLREYRITICRTVATSAIREASNRDLVARRVKLASGFDLEILESSEEARLLHQALQDAFEIEERRDELNGLVIAVGTGSLLLFYLENGCLTYSETVALGSVRLFDEAGRTTLNPDKIKILLRSLDLRRHLMTNCNYHPDAKINFIGIGAGIRALMALDHDVAPMDLSGNIRELPLESLRTLSRKAQESSPATIAEQCRIADYLALSVAPSSCIVDYVLEQIPCKKFLAPTVTTRQALLTDLIRSQTGNLRSFEPDLLATATTIGHKYHFDYEHARATADIALALFDKVKKYFQMDRRLRILLEIAALLHDIGRFVDIRQYPRHSFYLISQMQLPGLTPEEIQILALITRYQRKTNPKMSHVEYQALPPSERVILLQLTALLRVAEALEKNHRADFKKMRLNISPSKHLLKIKVAGSNDLAWERQYLSQKDDLFYEVFGMKIVIEEELQRI